MHKNACKNTPSENSSNSPVTLPNMMKAGTRHNLSAEYKNDIFENAFGNLEPKKGEGQKRQQMP